MNISLPDSLKSFVDQQVTDRGYGTSSEYVRDLVRERYLKEKERTARLQALDAALLRGIADAEAGRSIPIDDAFARLRKELDLAG